MRKPNTGDLIATAILVIAFLIVTRLVVHAKPSTSLIALDAILSLAIYLASLYLMFKVAQPVRNLVSKYLKI